MGRNAILPALCAMLLASGSAADAAIVTISGAFTATDWIGAGPAPGRIDPVYLSYRLTFDDDRTYLNATEGLEVFRTNLPYSFQFGYAPPLGVVIAMQALPGACGNPADSFCTYITDFASGVPDYVIQTTHDGQNWFASRITPGLPPVPEPSTWMLMIAGIGITGLSLRRRRYAVASAMAS